MITVRIKRLAPVATLMLFALVIGMISAQSPNADRPTFLQIDANNVQRSIAPGDMIAQGTLNLAVYARTWSLPSG